MSDTPQCASDQFDRLLVDYDEALARGTVAGHMVQGRDDLNPGQSAELQDAQDCLKWLETLLPRTESSRGYLSTPDDATELLSELDRLKRNTESRVLQSPPALRAAVVQSGIISAEDLETSLADLPPGQQPTTVDELASELVQRKILTANQALILCGGELQSLLLGDYLIQRRLGSGGMGTVYEALHRQLNKCFALKVLPRGATENDLLRARFQREMLAIGKLDHVNVVRATDAREEHGVHFLVMEAVQGCNVAQLVEQKGPLPIGAACEIIRQAATGLDYVHRRGLVHRDIKPANLMVAAAAAGNEPGENRPATVKILDLGLALLRTDDPDTHNLTATGQLMGTADYMAPEQMLDARKADRRSDIYSLGCTFYMLLTGVPPFGTRQFDTAGKKMLAHVQAAPTAIPQRRADVPAELVQIVERMLAKRPSDRFAAAEQVAEAVARWASQRELTEAVESYRHPGEAGVLSASAVETGDMRAAIADTHVQPRPKSTAKRRRVAVALGAVVLLVLAAGLLTLDPFARQKLMATDDARLTDVDHKHSVAPQQVEVAREQEPVLRLEGTPSSDASFSTPQIVGSFPTKNARAVQVVRSLAYVADNIGGLKIIDVSDPTSPQLTGTYETEGQCQGLHVVGNLAYLADRSRGLWIVDVSQPAHCTLVGHVAEGNLNDVRLEGDYAYGADQGGFLRIYHVADPSQASLIRSVQTALTPNISATRLKIAGNWLYLAHDRAGLLIFDLTDPRQPKQIGTLNLPEGQVMSVVVVGDLAYLGHGGLGLTIADVRNPFSPRAIGNLRLDGFGAELYVRGRYVYALNQRGLKVVDVSDPTQPVAVAQVDTPEVSVGLDVVGDTVYIADRFGGLQIVALQAKDDGGLIVNR